MDVDDVVPAQYFLGLGEGAVDVGGLGAPHPHGGGRLGALEGVARHQLAGVDELLGVGHVLGVDLLVLGRVVGPRGRIAVDEQHVLHGVSS